MSNPIRKILISGGSGFLGKNLLSKLVYEKYEITILSRNPDKISSYFPGINCISNQDFLTKKPDDSFDLFLHVSSDTRKQGELLDSVMANMIFPLSVMKVIESDKLKIINIDSTFYESEKNNYSTTKKQFSELLSLRQTPVFNFRIDNIYGETDNSNRFIPRMLGKLVRNEPVIELTHGTQERDFVNIQDVVELLDIAIKKIFDVTTQGYQTFDIGSGQPCTIKNAVLKLQDFSENHSSDLRFGAIDYHLKNNADLKSQIDITKTKKYFNWEPKITIEDGFKALIKSKKGPTK